MREILGMVLLTFGIVLLVAEFVALGVGALWVVTQLLQCTWTLPVVIFLVAILTIETGRAKCWRALCQKK